MSLYAPVLGLLILASGFAIFSVNALLRFAVGGTNPALTEPVRHRDASPALATLAETSPCPLKNTTSCPRRSSRCATASIALSFPASPNTLIRNRIPRR